METKRSFVKSAQFKRSYESKYGQLYAFDIVMENGDQGTYSSKSPQQTYFVAGAEANYTIETRQNGEYLNTFIKPVRDFKSSGAVKTGDGRNESFALSYSKDLLVAGKITSQAEMFSLADQMYAWLEGKKEGAK